MVVCEEPPSPHNDMLYGNRLDRKDQEVSCLKHQEVDHLFTKCVHVQMLPFEVLMILSKLLFLLFTYSLSCLQNMHIFVIFLTLLKFFPVYKSTWFTNTSVLLGFSPSAFNKSAIFALFGFLPDRCCYGNETEGNWGELSHDSTCGQVAPFPARKISTSGKEHKDHGLMASSTDETKTMSSSRGVGSLSDLKNLFPTKTHLLIFVGYMALFISQGL